MNTLPLKQSFFLLVTVSSVGWSGGFEGSGIGPRALSMGGAFVAVSDDWTAPYWNPAGLAFQSGWGVGGSLDFLSLSEHDGNSIANPTPPITRSNVEQGDPFFQFGGEPSHFNVLDTTVKAALPSIVAYKIWNGWAAAAGIFSPLGFAFDWQDNTVPGYAARFKDQGTMIMYNVSLARRLSSKWSFGAGVNFVDAALSQNATKETRDYTFQSSADGRGHAWQGVFGVLGHLTDRLSLGLVYKTGQDIALHGTASASDSQFPLAIPGIGTLSNEVSRQTTILRNPSTATTGLAMAITPSLTWTADWEYTDWTPMKTAVQFDQPGVLFQNQNFNAGWKATQRWRTGGEYRWRSSIDHGFSVRWGYTYDPSAVPDDAESLTNFIDATRNAFTTGASWHSGNWEPTLGFAYAEGSRTISSVVYKQIDRLISLALEYHVR